MKYLPLAIVLICPSLAWAFDSTEYRQATYGPPNHYCDVTLSIASPSGAGTIGDPWNLTRCMSEPVAGDVVGMLPGVGVDLPAPDGDSVVAFTPAHSGTSGSPIVYVTKYAAVALSSVESNGNRTELRHAGTAALGAGDGDGTGGAIYGAISQDYITFDGFYVDMAHAHPDSDTGVIRAELSTGLKFLNFVVKGTAETIYSNAVVYRPNGSTDTTLSNFKVYDFTNSGGLGQPSLFCDSYGDRNFIIEHFEITNVGKGIFLKGPYPTTPTYTHFNYGVIRYGIVKNGIAGLRLGVMSGSDYVDIHHVLSYGHSDSALVFSNEISSYRQHARLDHVTLIGGVAGGTQNGSLYIKADGGQGNRIENSIIDVRTGAGDNITSEETNASYATDFVSDYNGFSRNSANLSFYQDSTSYTTIAAWRTASGNDAHSAAYDTSSSDIFNNRASNDYTVAAGHAALTADSAGGELGAYEGSIDPGVDITGASVTGSTGASGSARFTGSVRIQ